MLAVTIRGALENHYGDGGYAQIRSALEQFAHATNATLLALDDADDMNSLGLPPGGDDSGSILFSIRNVMTKLGTVDSLLLVGGNSVIPYWRLANPVTDRVVDSDEQVLSDNPYGSTHDTWEEYFAPEIPVGRLPDFDRGGAQDFVNVIQTATERRESQSSRSSSTAVVNAEWLKFSQEAAAQMPGPVDWHLAPGYLMNQGTVTDTNRECLYFNLHGFSGAAEWKGYDPVRGQFVTAVTPNAFERQNVMGSVAFAENCYGAETIGRTPDNSCALRLVREGALFVGATGLAFGSHLTPGLFLDDADELAKLFWQALHGGATVGAALQRAKSSYSGGANPAQIDVFRQKTLLQFVLLGDPEWS